MDTVSVFIMQSEHEPLRLSVNGDWVILPIREDCEIKEKFVPLLRDTPGVKWRYTGAVHEDVEPSSNPDHFDALAVIDGTVEDVEGRLGDLTSEQLISVRAAEEGRDGATRKGVIAAINKAVEDLNEKDEN